jgi:hypothetical protein
VVAILSGSAVQTTGFGRNAAAGVFAEAEPLILLCFRPRNDWLERQRLRWTPVTMTK